MKAGVITFPGSNCDRDAFEVVKKVGFQVSKIWHQESNLNNDLDLIVVPGGFSYGDYLRSGAMAAISPVMMEVKRLADRGVKVIGICNGFQILTEAGLLEGALLKNKKGKFICRQVNLRVENNDSVFTSRYLKKQIVKFPIAHGDGNYFAEPDVLKRLEDSDSVAFRYVDEDGNLSDDANPNGSSLNIAGVFNAKKNVLGLMPHPERASEKELGSEDGLEIFKFVI